MYLKVYLQMCEHALVLHVIETGTSFLHRNRRNEAI
jgi:hypothetical protein